MDGRSRAPGLSSMDIFISEGPKFVSFYGQALNDRERERGGVWINCLEKIKINKKTTIIAPGN